MTPGQDAAIARLREQQAGLEQYSPQWSVAEQLMDICRSEPASAELIAADLDNPELSVTAAEKKIRAFANELSEKAKGSVCVPLTEADRILREFYGLPEKNAYPFYGLPEKDASPARSGDGSGGISLDLMDFLKG